MEDPSFTVLLTGDSPHDPRVLKAVRTVTGLSLWRCRQLLDSAPATVRSEIPFDIAARTAQHLHQAGVPAVIRCGWCRRTLPGDTRVDPGPCASPYWPTAHCQANSLTSCGCEFCAVHGPLPGHTTYRSP
ncbi:ribosomal protein L7/L12 [Kitasatospora sp. NBC_01266]|uniref:ribosomal protein L7/L12 n=1 Tax=Kitasatospora sp. NBC_01266 TaxID=2903572 RepID=UPI002E3805D0|nr:ribosomal protein L7/L12 [Kitasatospora sp. NBC_01266]